MKTKIAAAALLALAGAQTSAQDHIDVEAENARLVTSDAERFAELLFSAPGSPTAASLQTNYLDLGTRGVEIFTPDRIVDADNLADAIAEDTDLYARAVDVCLPAAQNAEDDLREVFAGYEDLLGDPALPEAYAVFGANNSGGTTGPDAIVIGLEVICRVADGDAADVADWLRRFFAHEVVHTLQSYAGSDPNLLDAVLVEGAADFIGGLVTGEPLNAELEAWARPREAELWALFRQHAADPSFQGFAPWLYTNVEVPEGWPADVGYWLGAQIVGAFYERQDDPREAALAILRMSNGAAILQASGYADRFPAPASE